MLLTPQIANIILLNLNFKIFQSGKNIGGKSHECFDLIKELQPSLKIKRPS